MADLYHLTSESWMALVRAWPRWRLPVTFGGGRVIMNRPLGFSSSALLRCKNKGVYTAINKSNVIKKKFHELP